MLYPPIVPFDHGRLQVSDGSLVYWEISGSPRGKPALYLHGGPGSGLGSGSYRRRFNPDLYLLVGLDQRGCGRSRPLIVDDLHALHRHTTQAQIADIEALRIHLGIETWLVSGVSWGTTLALAYAQSHPHRVTALVLGAVTTTSRAEVDWITETIGRVFPEAWEQFAGLSRRRPGERIVKAYARRLAGADTEDRKHAARDWNAWEAVHVSLDHGGRPHPTIQETPTSIAFATTVTHYWSNDGFLRGDEAILNRLDRIVAIPAELIHGRMDIGGPIVTPWRLHRRWPASRLRVAEGEGHGGPESMELMRMACDRFASG